MDRVLDESHLQTIDETNKNVLYLTPFDFY